MQTARMMPESLLKERIFQHRIYATDHFLRRIENRNISQEDIFFILLNRYQEIRLFCNSGKVMYVSERLSFLFEVNSVRILLITAMDFRAEPSPEVMVI